MDERENMAGAVWYSQNASGSKTGDKGFDRTSILRHHHRGRRRFLPRGFHPGGDAEMGSGDPNLFPRVRDTSKEQSKTLGR